MTEFAGESSHRCFSDEGWVACPPDLCEANRLLMHNEFLNRKLALMIPKVRIDEQIQLDKFEIGAIITWHLKMHDKCKDNNLTDRAAYHRTQADVLKRALPMDPLDEEDDNSAA